MCDQHIKIIQNQVLLFSFCFPSVFLLTLPLQLMGYLRYHQCDSPDAQFSQVACGAAHTCALSVAPWHSNAWGIAGIAYQEYWDVFVRICWVRLIKRSFETFEFFSSSPFYPRMARSCAGEVMSTAEVPVRRVVGHLRVTVTVELAPLCNAELWQDCFQIWQQVAHFGMVFEPQVCRHCCSRWA